MREAGFLLISLRPAGAHAGLRRAAVRAGGHVFALSTLRLREQDDAATRRQLRAALAAPVIAFTSPTAVRAATRLQPLRARRGQVCCGVGEGTRRALQRAGIKDAQAPARMDSEGLLALPAFATLGRGDVAGLVTAPGGRGEIARMLQARGVRVLRADVYARLPLSLSPTRITRLRQVLADAPSPVFFALSSGEAFEALLAQLPGELKKQLHRACVIAASARLAALARKAGFTRVQIAVSARPADLVAAVRLAMAAGASA